METSKLPAQSISISFPTMGLAHINHWAEKCSLTFAKFCTVALTLGARIQVISLEPVGSLTPPLRRQAAQAANTSITPEYLLRLVAGDKPELDSDSPVDLDGQVLVPLPADLAAQLDRVAEISGIEPGKLNALALATGVQLMVSSLAPGSSVPPDVFVQMTEGEVSPQVLLQAIMKRQEQGQSKERTSGTE